MADVSKNIQNIHNNGSSSINVGIKDDKFKIARDSADNTVAIKNADNTLGKLKVNKASISSTPTEDTDAANKKYVDDSISNVQTSTVYMKTWTASDMEG